MLGGGIMAFEAENVIKLLKEKDKKVGVAESCTGGLLCGALTSVSGSSECFGLGLVTYSNEAKHDLLGVPWEILQEYGAVSYETACRMAQSVMTIARAEIGLSITGIAGPTGGSAAKPVGLVYIGLAEDSFCEAYKFNFSGSRQDIREQTVKKALDVLRTHLCAE